MEIGVVILNAGSNTIRQQDRAGHIGYNEEGKEKKMIYLLKVQGAEPELGSLRSRQLGLQFLQSRVV